MLQRVDLLSEFRETLHAHDVELIQTFENVLACLAVDPKQQEARGAWNMADAELRSRLRMEEELMLPILELYAPHEAVRLRTEHHQIRANLDALGVELDLHQLDSRQCASFLALLHGHSNHEARVLHPWADQSLLPHTKSDVVWRIRSQSGKRSARAG
jgi:hypothetical protein